MVHGLSLKTNIAYRQHLVHDQNLRLQVRRYCESKSHIHATAVTLHRGIEESFDFGESDDFIEFLSYLRLGHAEDNAIEKEVFSAGELRGKPGPDPKQA